MSKENKAIKPTKTVNWATTFAIAGWFIIALAVSYGAGFYTAHTNAQVITNPKG